MKTNHKKISFNMHRVQKVLASFYIVAFAVSYFSANHSYSIFASDGKFTYENIAVAMAPVMVVILYTLSFIQKQSYWIVFGKGIKLDERQQNVRRKIFEKSYKIATILTVLLGWKVVANLSFIASITQPQNDFGMLYWLVFDVILLYIALPRLVAAFTKDS